MYAYIGVEELKAAKKLSDGMSKRDVVSKD
jgi:hypothetical protein